MAFIFTTFVFKEMRTSVMLRRSDQPTPCIMTYPRHLGSGYILPGPERAMRKQDKPAYSVPSIAEVLATPKNGFKVASTFSGCGGSTLGYKMAGFDVVYANDFEPHARAAYEANFPTADCDGQDIRKITADALLKRLGMQAGELDVLDGSPPCQAFSMNGPREKNWGRHMAHADGTTQRSDDLFFEYARILRGLQPKVFIAENVGGLVKGSSKGYFIEILAALRAAGYNVEARLLDAQWLGVPQLRQRVIFIGIRNDLTAKPAFPKPLEYRYSVRDACPWIVERGESHPTSEDMPNVDPADLVVTALGLNLRKKWDQLKLGQNHKINYNMHRAHPSRPSQAVGAMGGAPSATSIAHPYEPRKYTILEVKRLCSFPDDFKLIGTYQVRWARLGNAVPPLMMRAIAEVVRDEILQV